MGSRVWRTVGFLAVLLTSTNPAQARPLHYGALAGVNLANVRGSFHDLSETKMQPGLAAGAFADLPLGPPLALEIRVLYVQKGYKIESFEADQNGTPFTVVNHLRLQYLDLPVLAKIALPSFGAISPYVLGGPNFGFAVGGKYESSPGGSQDVRSGLKTVDVGVTAGLGLGWGAGPYSIGLESTFGTSFSDLWHPARTAESINQGVAVTAWVSR
jgi:outer membrane protein with beta-barrel domain